MKADHYAKLLRGAQIDKVPIGPLRHEIGETDIDFAYQIQNINTQHRIDQGARIVGTKIGLTSEVIQKQLGVDQPDFGVLFDDMEVLNGMSISASHLLQPKIEAEIAFIMAEDLDMQNPTIPDLIACIDYLLPALEIVGSRIENWDIRITDTIADNASASHFVLGHSPRTLDEVDIIDCNMKMMKNGNLVSEGKGSACLGSPLNAVLWLANKMMELGQPIEAGEIILSGAVGPMTDIAAGDTINSEIEGFGKVSVEIRD